MGRLLAVVAALAGACLLGAEAFIPALPAGGKAVQSQQGAYALDIGWGEMGRVELRAGVHLRAIDGWVRAD